VAGLEWATSFPSLSNKYPISNYCLFKRRFYQQFPLEAGIYCALFVEHRITAPHYCCQEDKKGLELTNPLFFGLMLALFNQQR
jgi:hypothetical protein